MSYEFIVLERDGGVGVITMNRPRVLNALNRAMYREIDAAISELEEDDSIAAIVITGAGERAFSAGADIHEMARIAEETGFAGRRPGPGAAYVASGDVLEADHRGYQWAGVRRGRGDRGEHGH